jgi:tetratricopeptide (TPR) repeat protein
LKANEKIWRADSLFLSISLISGLLAAFSLEPKMSMGRDWDLMSTMLAGVVISGIYFWHDRFSKFRDFKPATILLIILSLSIFIPWLGLHNSIRGLHNYNLALLDLDPKHGRSAFYTLISFHERQGNRAEVNRLRRYCETNFPEVNISHEAEALYKRGDYVPAISLLKKAIKHNPSFYAPYYNMGECWLKLGKAEEALDYLLIADALNPYNPMTIRLIDSLKLELK